MVSSLECVCWTQLGNQIEQREREFKIDARHEVIKTWKIGIIVIGL